MGGALGRSAGHLPHGPESARAPARRHAPASLARHGARAHPVPGAAGAHLLGGARRPAPPRPRLQRDGRSRRAQGAHRDRPRSPRFGLRRQPQPRDRSDEGRLGRGGRLAAAQCPPQHRERRHLGVDPSRRRRRHGLLAARRRGDRVRRHRGSRIEWVGDEAAVPGAAAHEVHDLSGAWVTPGLVDSHTHLVFAGTRATEYAERLRGRSYEEIALSGGGILTTVRAVRAASEEQLFDESAPRLASLLSEGVTTVEIKSGYGLTLADEAKMLRVARSLGRSFPVTVRTTLLAAHTLPPEYQGRADEYIDVVAREWLPELAGQGLVDALRAHRVALAVASDCNPGSAPAASLLTAMSMATRLFGLTAEEALLGATRHAARALGLEYERGALAPGQAADFVAWNVRSIEELGYWIGFNPRRTVVRAAEVLRWPNPNA